MSHRVRLALRLIIPATWLGMLIAIDLIEAPLKFQAPGITLQLGLGIGRLVFTAMNIAECVLAALLAFALLRPRPDRRLAAPAIAAFCLLAVKIAVLRPIMWQYTDDVLAGRSQGGSPLHFFYVAADITLFAALTIFLVMQARRLRLVPADEPRAAGQGAEGRRLAEHRAPDGQSGRGTNHQDPQEQSAHEREPGRARYPRAVQQ